MKHTTNWFEASSPENRKSLISFLFSVRRTIDGVNKQLFEEFLTAMDNDYQDLKPAQTAPPSRESIWKRLEDA